MMGEALIWLIGGIAVVVAGLIGAFCALWVSVPKDGRFL